MTSFRKISSTSLQPEVDGTYLLESCEAADAFTKHFQLVYNIPCPGIFPPVGNPHNFYQ
jgi:hypothetical protein